LNQWNDANKRKLQKAERNRFYELKNTFHPALLRNLLKKALLKSSSKKNATAKLWRFILLLLLNESVITAR